MTLLLIATRTLEAGLPVPVQAAPLFRAAGHRVYVACPTDGDGDALRARLDVDGVLPLVRGVSWGALVVNLYRMSYWARKWQPELYLSLSPRGALLAHSGRGSTGGYGLSVLYLSAPPRGWLQHHAFHEADRLIVEEESLAETLRARHPARGGDLTMLPAATPEALLSRSLAYFEEPPGVLV